MRQIWILAQHTIKALIRKKDFYVFFIMLFILLAFLVSEDFFGIQDVSRYIKDIGFFFLWFFSFILAAIFSAKQLPEELDSKMTFPLLAKPVSRGHLLLGRFLGSLLAVSFAYTIFYLLYIGVTFLKGGGVAIPLLIQTYILGICFLSLVSAISMTLALYLTLATAVTMTFIIYFAVMWFADAVRALVISSRGLSSLFLNLIYYLMPHYEFYDLRIRLAHSWDALPLWVVGAIVAYTLLYVSIVLRIGYLKLRKKVF
ncbi:MAG: hypothetical protein HQ547_07240 [Candidatus Omnitrophica bacterium]|nr:hypothetical protein [Candidatus Omnitrophota bacterium]